MSDNKNGAPAQLVFVKRLRDGLVYRNGKTLFPVVKGKTIGENQFEYDSLFVRRNHARAAQLKR